MKMGTYNDFYNSDLYDYNELKEKDQRGAKPRKGNENGHLQRFL
nr:MAG TPA: NAD(P)H-quinone oxidoreductase subunit 1 [Caudoviricetes sp.]